MDSISSWVGRWEELFPTAQDSAAADTHDPVKSLGNNSTPPQRFCPPEPAFSSQWLPLIVLGGVACIAVVGTLVVSPRGFGCGRTDRSGKVSGGGDHNGRFKKRRRKSEMERV